jgi:hypothetical protein
MKISGMGRVHRVLHGLEPVALQLRKHDDPALSIGSHQDIVSGQKRGRPRTHIDVEQTSQLLHGVGGMLNAVFVSTARRLRGLLYTPPLRIVKPAMVRATDIIPFEVSVGQGSAPVRAPLCYKTIATAGRTVENQIFAEYADPFDRLLFELLSYGNRVPVAAE